MRSRGVAALRILTDRGTEFCGKLESHPYEIFLALNDIERRKTKARSPQTNGICGRFHKTVLDEFLIKYNTERPNRGKHCEGRSATETFEAGKEVVREKLIA